MFDMKFLILSPQPVHSPFYPSPPLPYFDKNILEKRTDKKEERLHFVSQKHDHNHLELLRTRNFMPNGE